MRSRLHRMETAFPLSFGGRGSRRQRCRKGKRKMFHFEEELKKLPAKPGVYIIHGGGGCSVLPRHPVYPQKQTQSGIRPYLFFTTGDARFRASLSAPQIRKAPPCCAQDFTKSAQFMTARTGFPQNFTALLRFMTGRFAWTARRRYAEKKRADFENLKNDILKIKRNTR